MTRKTLKAAKPKEPIPLGEQLSIIAPHLGAAAAFVVPTESPQMQAHLISVAIERFLTIGHEEHNDSLFHKSRQELAKDLWDEFADALIYAATLLSLNDQGCDHE